MNDNTRLDTLDAWGEVEHPPGPYLVLFSRGQWDDPEDYYSPQIAPDYETFLKLRQQADDGSAGNVTAVGIPILNVVAAPKLLEVLKTIMFGLPELLERCPKKYHVLQTYKECAVGRERAEEVIKRVKGGAE